MTKKLLIIIIFFAPFSLRAITNLEWIVGFSDDKENEPEEYITAAVPGAVQLDFAKAMNYSPLYFADNWKDYSWMEDKFFTYKTTFKKPDINKNERLFFISKGIDYEFDIILNDQILFYQEGMFSWVRLDLTESLRENNQLKIIVYPVPKSKPLPQDRSQADHSVKPAVSYGWDWHPRLVPLGIWDDTYLEIQPLSYINDIWVDYKLNDKFDEAVINLKTEGRNLNNTYYIWELIDKENRKVLESDGEIVKPKNNNNKIILKNPVLWWPHDFGEPYLYTSVFRLFDENDNEIQTIRQKVGFRDVKLVMNEGAWREPTSHPMTRSNAPAQFQINGLNIFAKGTNWVNPEIFPGIITGHRYNELTDLAVRANFNTLRIWGGGIVNKESFYEQCDEKGLLVWQEFPLACNNYPDDKNYLKILEQEAVSIVKRLKKHTSVVLWSGGNELFNNWSGMTDQSLALRLLNSITLKHNPEIPFIATSPLMGMAHGNYVFRDLNTGEEVYSIMQNSHFTAYTEFGMPSPSSEEIIKMIIPENELWPPAEKTSWETHHAFNAWGKSETWLMPKMIEDYFGPVENLKKLVEYGQLMQCEGYKAIYEEARRQKPYCSMALNWCYNEPWPTAANNSIINYPNIPKPAFYAVANACRPVCASARIPKFRWKKGEDFSVELWILNDLPKEVKSERMTAVLIAGNDKIEVGTWTFDKIAPLKNSKGPQTSPFRLPDWDIDRFTLTLEVEGIPEYNSEYLFLYEK